MRTRRGRASRSHLKELTNPAYNGVAALPPLETAVPGKEERMNVTIYSTHT